MEHWTTGTVGNYVDAKFYDLTCLMQLKDEAELNLRRVLKGGIVKTGRCNMRHDCKNEHCMHYYLHEYVDDCASLCPLLNCITDCIEEE